MTDYLFIVDTPQIFLKNNKSLKDAKLISEGYTVHKFYSYKDDDKIYITKSRLFNDQIFENIPGNIYKVNSYIIFNTDLEKGHPIDVDRNIVDIIDKKGKSFKCYIYFNLKINLKKTPLIVKISNMLSIANSNYIYKDLTDNFEN